MSESKARGIAEVMIFSDDVNTRNTIMNAIGQSLGPGYPQINFFEVATGDGVRQSFSEGRFAALILDGETAKEGGASVASWLHNMSNEVPPIIMLTARPQDSWLARWAKSTEIICEPFDPQEVQEVLKKVLRRG